MYTLRFTVYQIPIVAITSIVNIKHAGVNHSSHCAHSRHHNRLNHECEVKMKTMLALWFSYLQASTAGNLHRIPNALTQQRVFIRSNQRSTFADTQPSPNKDTHMRFPNIALHGRHIWKRVKATSER